MTKQTMKSINWDQLLHGNAELLKIMPTELRTPWLCHIAFQKSDNPLGTDDEKHVPEHLRDAVTRLSNWEDEEYLDEEDEYYNNDYDWSVPYERPFNETGEIQLSQRCLVCGGTPDGIISTNYFAINGLHCCDTCYEEHIKHDTRRILWHKPGYTDEGLTYWNTMRCMEITTLVKQNTDTEYTRHCFGIPPYQQWVPQVLPTSLAYDIQNYNKQPILRIVTAIPVAA